MNESMTKEEAEALTRKIKDAFTLLGDDLRELGELRSQLPRVQEQAQGFVYFIQAQDSLAIKIGYAVDVEKRLAVLQTGCPEELVVVGMTQGTVADEKALHAKFNLDHIRGEWFRASDELVKYILEVSN